MLVHNFLPNVVERHGSDYESLRARNPRLIYAEITGYGSSGPLRDTPAYDSVAGAVGGLWHITGDPNGPPVRVSRAHAIRPPKMPARGCCIILTTCRPISRVLGLLYYFNNLSTIPPGRSGNDGYRDGVVGI